VTPDQILAVQRKFYEMSGMRGELVEEGLDRLASGFGRYGYESHRQYTDEEWERETREELHDAFVMLTGLEASRHGGGDPLGMVVGVVLKHLADGFSVSFVEEMVRTLGELAWQDGHEMLELAFALGETRTLVDISVGSFPRAAHRAPVLEVTAEGIEVERCSTSRANAAADRRVRHAPPHSVQEVRGE
jgi:hypothetical protein